MSTSVLARKWRPKNFSELVGQQHVMQALSNALDQKRLHHAYLFTGTRGVGKTTIARIFSKALNCEQGMSSQPCGQCATCQSIDQGRFVDLIEVDAASRTKVEDTRELLENVQYAPVQGRYKVYLIDEVHMLSKSSFNALLKTLEEPPEHVKFLLATTDPHKLPITVLSRCLQFNLMRLTTTQLQQHLAYILGKENIAFDEKALSMIAKSADGSARDALSILDQAIAYGGGQVVETAVKTMLGLIDQHFVEDILSALMERSPDAIKHLMGQLATLGVNYEALNAQLLEALHQVALVQMLGAAQDGQSLDVSFLEQAATQLSPEKVQVLYQIALLAQQDMGLAPDIRIGFEMALLRMLAFEPMNGAIDSSDDITSKTESTFEKNTRPGGLSNTASAVPQDAPLQETSTHSSASASSESEFMGADMNSAPMSQSQSTVSMTPSSYGPHPVSEGSNNAVATGDDSDAQDHLAALKAKLSQTLGKFKPGVEDSTPKASNASKTPELPKINEPTDVSDPGPEVVDAQPSHQPQHTVKPSPQSYALSSDDVNGLAETENSVGSVDERNGQNAWPEEKIHSSPFQPLSNEFYEQEQALSQDRFFDAAPNNQDRVLSSESSAYAREGQGEAGNAPLEGFEPQAPQAPLSESNRFDPMSTVANASEKSPGFQTNAHLREGGLETPQAQETSFSDKATSNFQGAHLEVTSQGPATLDQWLDLIHALGLEGLAKELANQSMLVSLTDQTLKLSVDPNQRAAQTDLAVQRLEERVRAQLGVRVEFAEARGAHETPARLREAQAQQNQEQAVRSIYEDPVVQTFVNRLNMKILDQTITPN